MRTGHSGHTTQFTVTGTQYSAVVTHSACKRVRITENRGVPGHPNGDYLVAKPTDKETPVQIEGGTAYEFESGQYFFPAGVTVGYIKMADPKATTSFDQDEGQSWQ